MDMRIKEEFIRLWHKYFHSADLPIVFWYTDEENPAEKMKPAAGHRCIIGELSRVRRGETLCYSAGDVGCGGGKKFLGFTDKVGPNFEYFLSCGIPGKMEGERYKKSPDLVLKALRESSVFKAPSRFIVFKRWDMLEGHENPEVVIFFAGPDVISGLFTLANYDRAEPNGVISPFSSGCGSIVFYPYLENDSSCPRAVLGMFDVTARPYVAPDILTFSVPYAKFLGMIDNIEESFLITPSWKKVRERIM
ncbi:DUF169 domain-containing protein [bacterium]|nr:DUF169 domain-containing protein [bacterium]